MGWSWKWQLGWRTGDRAASGTAAVASSPVDFSLLDCPRFRAEVESALGKLKSAAAILEQQFGSTVTALYALNDRGRALVTSSERLVEIASGRHSGMQVLFDGLGLIEAPLQFLAQYRGRLESERILDRLVQDLGMIRDCLRAESAIDRTLEPLRTVRTLFKVVAAPLGESVQQIFESLVEELSALHEQARAMVGEKFAEMVRVRERLDAMLTEMRTQQTYWGELARQREEMQQSLGGLEAQLVANAQKETRIGSSSKRIASAIERVVTGLQWQDIINQKLEHICKAVSAILVKLQEAGQSAAVINHAARLELAQLRAARQELANAEAAITEGLSCVLGELKQSDTSVVLLSEFQLLTTSSSGVVQLLLDSIESIDAQLTAALRSASNNLSTIGEVRAAADALNGAVRELSERTLLVGLNAQVQSCKVAQGAGLGVLSARTSDVSGLVASIGDSVASKLERITSDLGDCARIFTGLITQAEERCGSFQESRSHVEQSLHGLRDEAFQLVHSTGGAIEEIDKSSKTAMLDTRYMASIEAEFAELEGLLEKLVAATGGEALTPSVQSDDFADTVRSYTMASEREVFAAMSGATAAVGAAVEAATDPELFDSPSPDATARSATASGADDNVELF